MKSIENPPPARLGRRALCRGALAALALPYGLRAAAAPAAGRAPAPRAMQRLSEAQLSGRDDAHVREIPLSQANEVHLQPEVGRSFLALREAAAEAGIKLRIVSGFRSFSRQRRIWNDKLAGRRALLDAREKPLQLARLTPRERVFALLHWSALPGASRHHWGTDCDVYDGAAIRSGYRLRLTAAESASVFARLHRWLDQRIAADQAFGFYRPYRGQGGVAAEPWHLSFRPLARLCEPRVDPDFIRRVLHGRRVALKDVALENLQQIYEQFIAPYREDEHE